MESFLKDKKINIAIFVFLIIISLFTVSKLFKELSDVSIAQSDNTITVDGSGEVSATADIATIDINLTKDGATAKEAQSSLNEIIAKTITYLKTQNIEDKDIKSEYGGLSPKYIYEKVACYSYPCSNNQKIVGYTASQSITVKIREVDNASIVRTGLAELGISNINGPTFSIDDEETLKAEARKKAIDNAKAKAEVLAKQLGVKIGKVVNFSENNNGYFRYEAKNAMSSSVSYDVAQSAAPSLPLGENKIQSNVIIIYEIK